MLFVEERNEVFQFGIVRKANTQRVHLVNSVLKPRHIGICQTVCSLDVFLSCTRQAKRGNSAVPPLQNLGQKRQHIGRLRCISRILAIPLLANNRSMMLRAIIRTRATRAPDDKMVGSGVRFAGANDRIIVTLQHLRRIHLIGYI